MNDVDSRLILRMISWIFPEDLGESILGDLEEEQHLRAHNAAWLYVQLLGIFGHFAWKRAFGSTHNLASYFEQAKGDSFMQIFWNYLRFGARMLFKTPLFTVVCAVTLALGIGANTAIFSIVNSLLIQPLPLPESQQLIMAAGFNEEGNQQYISYPDFQDLQSRTKLFDGFSAFAPQSVNLTGRFEPQRLRGGFVSDNFFRLLKVQPAAGRGFIPGTDDLESADRVCILQHQTWKTVFNGDPKIIGQTIKLNNEMFSVVGIMPETFRFPIDEVEVWIPHHNWPAFRGAMADGSLYRRSQGMVQPLGRLKTGINLQQGQAEIKSVFAELSKQYSEGGKRTARIKTLKAILIGDVRLTLLVLLAAVAFVLLIACANVANLMVSRAASRKREFATRAALGAGRIDLVAQLFAEIGLLWLIGCVVGLILGNWGLHALLAAAPEDLPGGITASFNSTVLAFALAITAITALLFGMIPAFRFSSPNLINALKEGTRAGAGFEAPRVRSALVVGQVALALILLTGSGLMLRSFQKLVQVKAGFQSQNLLTMEYRLPANKYPEKNQQWQVHKRIIETVRNLPGVRAASLTNGLPFSGNGGLANIEIPSSNRSGHAVRTRAVSVEKDYFRTMGISILKGRAFNDRDSVDSPLVVIINQYLADRYWPNKNAIGQTIRVEDEPHPLTAQIIGIVGNTKQYGLDDPEIGFIYGAQSQDAGIFNTIVVRTARDPMAMANTVRAAVWSVDPEQPVWKIRTQQYLIDRSLGFPRFLAQLMACYAILALLLAAIGIYGVISYSVTRRTYEIGVRMAFGAQKTDVLRMVLQQGLLLTGLGLLIGIGGAVALGRLIQTMLFSVKAADPATLLIVSIIMASIAVLASYLPARRAARVDPLLSLRYD